MTIKEGLRLIFSRKKILTWLITSGCLFYLPPSVQAQTLAFRELLPRPTSNEVEYLEIVNLSQENISSAGWHIADEAKRDQPSPLPDYLLAPGQIWHIDTKTLGLSLNNEAETLYLWQPDGTLADSLNYTKAPSGAIYRRYENNWEWIENTMNPSSTTSIVQEATTPPASQTTTTLDKARGIVSALPYQLSSQYFYITSPDNTSGLKIYCYYKLWPQLKLGDLIEINGTLVSTTQEIKLNIKGPQDIKIISSNNQLKVKEITTQDINTLMPGQLVVIKGKVAAKNQSTIYLTDDFGEILIQLKTGTDLKNSNFTVGERYRIVGLIIDNNG
ncbi:MAG TPA: lamin tail domain-containing protein, partial [bacterium]|nr:lamin tail domain-containing protein [bacterium]